VGFFYFFPDAGIRGVGRDEGLGSQRIGGEDTLTPMDRIGKARQDENLSIK
jgi:hypothetical protein